MEWGLWKNKRVDSRKEEEEEEGEEETPFPLGIEGQEEERCWWEQRWGEEQK